MWIRLGVNELINLKHVVSIKKGASNTLDIQFDDFKSSRVLPFAAGEDRDAAFDRLILNLEKLGNLME